MYESHCPVCLDIYIEPVLLPCEHCFCKPCFDEIVRKANLQCPVCRRRIGSWARVNGRNGTLVNNERWEYIKKHFAVEVKARQDGKITPKRQGAKMREHMMVKIANTGEIKKEYENELEKLRKEREEQDKASEELIKRILAQEKEEIEAITRNDQEPSEKIHHHEASAAFRKANKVNKPRKMAADIGETSMLPLPRRSTSVDSITSEFSHHFKPIVRYPRTPPRQDDKYKGYPETIKVTPGPQAVKRIDFSQSCSPPDSGTGVVLRSGNRDKPLTDISCNIPTTSSADYQFTLPLQSSISHDDHCSNDSCSLNRLTTEPSSSRNTSSKCNSRLYIATSSTEQQDSHCQDSDSSSKVLSTSRLTSPYDSSCDTVSYRSDSRRSSSRDTYVPQVKKQRKANGHRPRTGSPRVNGHSKSRSKKGSSLTNGASAANNETNGRLTRSRSSNRTRSQSSWSYLSSVSSQSTNSEKANHFPQSFNKQDITVDELYATKLQKMYDMESMYRLNTLRCAGSGNEYFTRSRKRSKYK